LPGLLQSAISSGTAPGRYLVLYLLSYNGDTSKLLTYHTIWDRLKKIGLEAFDAGIIKRKLNVTPHMMRRTYAAELYRNGMGIKGVQYKLRHEGDLMTMQRYIYDEDKAEPVLKKIFEGVV
jgi:integrase